MRTKFKAWTEPYIQEHKEVMLSKEEMTDFNKPYYLEIGSGKGGFLVNMALKNPDLFFIGIEKNVTCSGITCKKLVEQEIGNAKLIFDDADKVLDFINDKSIKTIFLNFSDPWPKKRHHKRRLTSASYFNKYYRILEDEGKIIFKTDNVDLFTFTIELIPETKFEIESISDDYDGLDPFDTMTEYEKSFRDIGTPIHRVILRKKHD